MKMILLYASTLILVLLSWAIQAKTSEALSVEEFINLHIHATKQANNHVEEVATDPALDGIWVNPVETAKVSSKFKAKERFRKSKQHLGIDLAATLGDDIVAAARGVVIIADGESLHENYGNVVIIDHGEGVVSLYAHMESIAVNAGDVVGAGSYIGTVGSTGRSSGPHVHFEILTKDQHVDPAALIEFGD